jgi:2-methylcitrate dehydratase PrpD
LRPKSSGGGIAFKMRDGRELTRMHKYPPGHPQNSLNDADLAGKFFELADGVISAANAQRVIDEVAEFETCENIGELLSRMLAV